MPIQTTHVRVGGQWSVGYLIAVIPNGAFLSLESTACCSKLRTSLLKVLIKIPQFVDIKYFDLTFI